MQIFMRFRMLAVYLIIPIVPSLAAENNVDNLGRLISLPTNLSEDYSLGYYASKDTYGMRSHAVVAAFKANASKPFDFPILGINFAKELGRYLDRDSVGLYADNTALPFKKWEEISSAEYTPTSFSASGIDNFNIKPGMIIDTNHNPKWSSYVVSVHENKVTTSGWVNLETKKLGTPKNGIGLTVNPITKIWATNFNIFIPMNGRASNGVIQENGLINNKVENPVAINGIDTVILSGSKYGGTAAYLARSSSNGNMQRWKYGFISQGAINSFISSDLNGVSPIISFLDQSTSNKSLVFSGRNKESSIEWLDGEKTTAKIDPKGRVVKKGYVINVVTESFKINDESGLYIIKNKKPIVVTLSERSSIIKGVSVKIIKPPSSDGYLIFKTDDNTPVNGMGEYRDYRKAWNGNAVYDGMEWTVY